MKVTCIILFCLLSKLTIAQIDKEAALFKNFPVAGKVDDHKYYLKLAGNNHNEIEFILSSLYVGYKMFFSSQDASNCVFTPSCSDYAIQTVKKNGLLVGPLDAIDRLMRCNTLSPDEYKIDKQTKHLFDPVK